MNSLYSRFDILAMISFIARRYVSADVVFFAARAFSSFVVIDSIFMGSSCVAVCMAWCLVGVKANNRH